MFELPLSFHPDRRPEQSLDSSYCLSSLTDLSSEEPSPFDNTMQPLEYNAMQPLE
ncbi:hypothetical protein LguiA_032398 [Lonicera macranthoides]